MTLPPHIFDALAAEALRLAIPEATLAKQILAERYATGTEEDDLERGRR